MYGFTRLNFSPMPGFCRLSRHSGHRLEKPCVMRYSTPQFSQLRIGDFARLGRMRAFLLGLIVKSPAVKRIVRGFHPPRRSITPYRAPYAADPCRLSGCHASETIWHPRPVPFFTAPNLRLFRASHNLVLDNTCAASRTITVSNLLSLVC